MYEITLDLSGLKCPLPALKTRKRLQTIAIGARLEVLTTDPLATIDIPHLVQEMGYILHLQEKTQNGNRFVIEKKA